MSRKNRLLGKRIAVLVDAGFNSSEYYALKNALLNVGAEVETVSPSNEVRAWTGTSSATGWGDPEKVDKTLGEETSMEAVLNYAKEYDGVVIPGGALHVDRLRSSENTITFIKHFLEEGKPIAAFNQGVQTLISTGEVSGLHLTSPKSMMRDFIYAGAHWDDLECVTDHGLVTGKGTIESSGDSPEIMHSFCETMLNEFTSELSPSHVRIPRTLQSQVLH